jgi:hypothetical protein
VFFQVLAVPALPPPLVRYRQDRRHRCRLHGRAHHRGVGCGTGGYQPPHRQRQINDGGRPRLRHPVYRHRRGHLGRQGPQYRDSDFPSPLELLRSCTHGSPRSPQAWTSSIAYQADGVLLPAARNFQVLGPVSPAAAAFRAALIGSMGVGGSPAAGWMLTTIRAESDVGEAGVRLRWFSGVTAAGLSPSPAGSLN